MKISSIELYHLRMPLKFDFVTAKTILRHRDTLIIKVTNNVNIQGFGEVVAFLDPFYTNETLENAIDFLMQIVIPEILKHPLKHPFEIHTRFKNEIQYFPMAIAGLENALLDLYAKNKKENLISSLFCETLQNFVPLGIVLGDLPLEKLSEKIEENTHIGSPRFTNCKRFKLKIKPKMSYKKDEINSFEKLKILTTRFPHLQFLADANCSFPLDKIDEIMEYDALNLLCIEEPFAVDSLLDYQHLDICMKTPFCFDENIQDFKNLQLAYDLGILQMLNIKIGRMGGLYPTKKAIDFCREKNIPFWIGSMVESGISKILHVQLSALKGNCIAGDLSDSKRYFEKDMIIPDIMAVDGYLEVPHGIGIGVDVDLHTLKEYCYKSWKFNA